MSLNNIYNFRNPIRHFLNIDAIKKVSITNINDLCWTEPFPFRVKKQEDEYRTIKMPNIINFIHAYEHYKDLPSFNNVNALDPNHKRLTANTETGDFVTGEYDRQLDDDLEKLAVYDNLLKLDIKDCYGRIYTHKLSMGSNHNERYLTNLNNGGTNGLILGNYISLYFAESYLSNISHEIERLLMEKNINCKFSYFSDDFYFFCNHNDIDVIVKVFDDALDKFNFERNINKKEIWTYETYNNYNLITRYWKKIIAHSNVRFDGEKANNRLFFLNQLIYRTSELKDNKLKKTLVNNFFKTRYFQERPLQLFEMRNFDYHQLCYILRSSPESLLYTSYRLSDIRDFDIEKLKEFFSVRYEEALLKTYHEEQLYFYYAIKVLGFNDILSKTESLALHTKNQILISYYLKDHIFSQASINILKANIDESLWFQNYHLILYTTLSSDLITSVNKYLIPDHATKPRQKSLYANFYTENLQSFISLIRPIDEVTTEIKGYLNLRIAEVNFVSNRN